MTIVPESRKYQPPMPDLAKGLASQSQRVPGLIQINNFQQRLTHTPLQVFFVDVRSC